MGAARRCSQPESQRIIFAKDGPHIQVQPGIHGGKLSQRRELVFKVEERWDATLLPRHTGSVRSSSFPQRTAGRDYNLQCSAIAHPQGSKSPIRLCSFSRSRLSFRPPHSRPHLLPKPSPGSRAGGGGGSRQQPAPLGLQQPATGAECSSATAQTATRVVSAVSSESLAGREMNGLGATVQVGAAADSGEPAAGLVTGTEAVAHEGRQEVHVCQVCTAAERCASCT